MAFTDAMRPSPSPAPSPLPSPTRTMKPLMTVPSTPTRKESRRRSWFGLVTPTRNKDKDRSVSEGAAMPVPAGRGGDARHTTSLASDDNSIEELDVTPVRRSHEDRNARRPWAVSGNNDGSVDVDVDDSDSDFSDWEITGTVRRKRTARPGILGYGQYQQQQQTQDQDQDQNTPVRQKDLATLAILSRNDTVKPKQPTSRIFSRTANVLFTGPTSPEIDASTTLSSSNLPQRTVSIPPPLAMFNGGPPVLAPLPLPLAIEKSPVNKPLPDLPPTHEVGGSLRAVSLPFLTSGLPPSSLLMDHHQHPRVASSPVPPTDIVVTPSSPTDKDPFDMSFKTYDSGPAERPFSAPPTRSYQDGPANRILPSAHRSESPSPMPTPSPIGVRGGAPIGLGLPEGHPRRIHATSRKPLPAIVSVSSPIPLRSSSPSNKVTFSTEQGSHDYESKDPSDKVKAPRPRSFSAMFSRSPLLNGDHTDDEDAGSSSSKFNWLGVRKTIKRRRSEAKLNQQKSPAPPTSTTADDVAAAAWNPAHMSTPTLVQAGPAARPESSSTNATARPATATGFAPEVSTPSSIQSFILPPVVQATQDEWWPATEWHNDTRGGETSKSSPVRASPAQSISTPPVPTSGDEREEMMFVETDSRDSHGSGSGSRRLPPSRGSSLLSNSGGGGLGALPEGGVAPVAPPNALGSIGIAPSSSPSVPPIIEQSEPPAAAQAQPPRRDHNRRRSYSDAGRRSFVPMTEEAQSLQSSPRSNFLAALTGEPSKSPKPPRPASTTLVKMRSVFTMGGRSRSNSALRFGANELENGGRDTPHTRPASSASAASSYLPSPALPPVRIRPDEVPHVSQLQLYTGSDDRVILVETPERSPRSSYAASLTSTTRTSQSTRRSVTADPHAPTGGLRAPRARAQTISSGAISFSGTFGITTHSNHSATGGFGHPPSVYNGSVHRSQSPLPHSGSAVHLPIPTPTFPTSSTPPRRPVSIRRLSTGLFRAGAVSPKPHSGVVRSGSGPIIGVPDDFNPGSQPQSRSGSVMGMAPTATVDKGLDKKDVDTKVHPDDTPEAWLARVLTISRRQLSSILAQSSDKFHMDSLHLYMGRFDFHHTALDVALRRLLMDLSLPKETQQIDRVVETFSQRYDVCEPGLFGTKDNTYVLAFSMMMLHTDAFNRHNKNKMTKADYVRNTRLDGVPETVLEAFYDNITFTPFVFIEDDNEASLAAVGASTIANGPVRPGKVDVYDMIAGGTVMTLRANVESLIPPDSPFSCMGTQAYLDVDRLQRSFADAHPLSFVKSRPRRKSSVTSALPGSLGDKTPVKSTPKEEIQTLKITKVGLISRKDDTYVNGKRPSGRKWKNWSIILTGSQLLFFKDTILALTLVEQIRHSGDPDQPLIPRMTGFQPDEVLSVKDCVAVWDREYTESQNAFRFIMPEGKQYLMQALDETEMNEWLTLINYASTFKSAGIRMRALAIESGEAILAGTAAAESHRKALAGRSPSISSGVSTPATSQSRAVIFAESPTAEETTPQSRPKLRRVGSLRSTPTPKVDIAGANHVVVGGGEQIEAVIGSVKAELAAGRCAPRPQSMAIPRTPSVPAPLYKSARGEAIHERVMSLRDEAGVIEKRLATNLRIGRNLALLTPFQKVTRDRIEAAVPDLAGQIRNDRIELAKLHLWITMLLKDQERDEREWARVRHVALQAAAKSLRNGLSVMDRRATLAHPIAIPKLSLPDNDDPWTEPHSPSLISPVSPGLMSPPGISRGESSSSDIPTTSKTDARMSAMSGISSVSAISDDPSSNSQRNSSASGSSDYELASEYLSASSVLSLHEELERHLSTDGPLLTLGTGSSNSGSTPSTGPTNGHVTNGNGYPYGYNRERDRANRRSFLPQRPDDQQQEHLVDSTKHHDNSPYTNDMNTKNINDDHDDADGANSEMAEHWRNTRAATKVSLARLPRGGLGEIQQRIGQTNWI